MRKLRALALRLAAAFGMGSRDRGIDRELESHLQLLVDDNLRAGMTPDEARRRALARFGSVESVKETYQDRRGLPFVETTVQDVRYALRMLTKQRGATAVGILVMALGIGANTAVFSVVHAVLLNPLPYPDAERIVTLTYGSGAAGSGDRSRQVSIPDVLDWQRDAASFDAMAFYSGGRTPVMADAAAEYAVVTRVSEQFFQVFGMEPSIGRPFTREESAVGGPVAAIVSDRYARQHFGEPARAIGRTLRIFVARVIPLPPGPVPIVGVLPAAFDYPAGSDIWFPLQRNASGQNRRGNNYLAVARLKPGLPPGKAQAEMSAISARLAAQYPDTNRDVRVLVTGLQREIVGNVEAMLYLLLGAVGVVLLIACATMATLLLARATARVPEIAVRAALGASRSRIIRQLLVEASVQAVTAGAVGVAVAVAGTRTLVAFSPPDVPRLAEVAVNGRVLLFALALSVLVSILFGLPPALQAARIDAGEPLRRSAGRVAGGAGYGLRQTLVVLEIALAVVLVATGALLVRTVLALQHAPLGFDAGNVVVAQASASPRREDWSDSREFFRGLIEDVARVPGVVAVGAMMGPPGQVGSESGYWLDRMPKQSPLSSARPAVMNVITPGAFAALAIPIRQGRDFDDRDTSTAPKTVIVNEALTRAAFAGRDPIGRQIVAGFDSMDPMTIVGVVGDIRQYGPDREPQPEVYMPYQQHFYNAATLRIVAKAANDPAALGPILQRKARERNPEVALRVTTLEAVLAEHVATPRFRAWLLSLFAGVALCLAMAGVYGVMAYVAGQRTKEIGVRMALGASTNHIRWLMLASGLKLTVAGLVGGVLGAIACARLLGGMLFSVQPYDAATYAVVVAALAVLSLLATYMPARRALRVDPVIVLRQE